jgi:hypothetical protein
VADECTAAYLQETPSGDIIAKRIDMLSHFAIPIADDDILQNIDDGAVYLNLRQIDVGRVK